MVVHIVYSHVSAICCHAVVVPHLIVVVVALNFCVITAIVYCCGWMYNIF